DAVAVAGKLDSMDCRKVVDRLKTQSLAMSGRPERTDFVIGRHVPNVQHVIWPRRGHAFAIGTQCEDADARSKEPLTFSTAGGVPDVNAQLARPASEDRFAVG